MQNRLKKYEVDLAGSIFNADKWYDGERNFESLIGIYFQISSTLLQIRIKEQSEKIWIN
ncbi:MAG: hypothetical protein WAM14_04560 [Candidatus Nitrosopolaris sp.]